nr:TPA_inf: conotoxin precursor J [Conus ebraeus]
MASVQSVTCCCLLWLMLSGSPGTAQPPGHPSPDLCKLLCENGLKIHFCDCKYERDVDSLWIRRRKGSTVRLHTHTSDDEDSIGWD